MIVAYGLCWKIEIEFYTGLIENIINNAILPISFQQVSKKQGWTPYWFKADLFDMWEISSPKGNKNNCSICTLYLKCKFTL